MHSTGIVRRIDDLGRVAIPKEIRRSMHICEGDPLEIFLEGDAVCFKKQKENYSRFLNDLAHDLSLLVCKNEGYLEVIVKLKEAAKLMENLNL